MKKKANNKVVPKRRNPGARIVRENPHFKPRTVGSKKAYSRKTKYKDDVG